LIETQLESRDLDIIERRIAF